MKGKKGGIKTSIILFSLLVILSLLLFLFVFSIFSNNKTEITKKLTNVNECADINYDILNTNYQDTNLTITLRNSANSKIIQKIYVFSNQNVYQKEITINPNEIKKFNIQNLILQDEVNLYVNDCDEYMKIISVN